MYFHLRQTKFHLQFPFCVQVVHCSLQSLEKHSVVLRKFYKLTAKCYISFTMTLLCAIHKIKTFRLYYRVSSLFSFSYKLVMYLKYSIWLLLGLVAKSSVVSVHISLKYSIWGRILSLSPEIERNFRFPLVTLKIQTTLTCAFLFCLNSLLCVLIDYAWIRYF